MQIVIQRVTQTSKSTTGSLSIDGSPFCVTLEPPKVAQQPPDGNGFVCVDAGIFKLTIRWSNRFQKQVPHVEDVPHRTAIEHHVGNYARDTDGCALIGRDYGTPLISDYVSQSSATFEKYMARLYAAAVLTNPGADEQHQIWNVGTVEYKDIPANTAPKQST